MEGAHTVKSFDKDLHRLTTLIADMGELARAKLAATVTLLDARGGGSADRRLESDARLGVMARDVDLLTVQLLALRQPLAIDLRSIVAALKIAADLERVGDYVAGIARHMDGIDPGAIGDIMRPIQEMAQLVLHMLVDTMQAYHLLNAGKAVEVWQRDKDINAIYTRLLTEFPLYMERDPHSVSVFTSLLFISRCLERIGDHIKNVDEHIYFLVHGEIYGKKAAAG